MPGVGGYPSQVWMEGYPGYPWSGLDGGGGTQGIPPPTRQSSIANTCYAAGGMPLRSRRRTFLFFDRFRFCSRFRVV